MKAVVRVLISVLALVVASVVTAPAAQAQSPATQRASAAAVAAPAAAGAVVSVPPARIADSRDGVQIAGAVAALSTAGVQVTGRGGIPGSGVAAVLATVTVVGPQQGGHLNVWSSGSTRPGTSNLNFRAGETIANTVLVRVGTGGGIQVFNGSYGSVQVIVDVTGYIRSGTPTAAGAVAALTPARIVDSRVGQQLPGPVPGLAAEDIQIGGQGGIPLTRVAGVVATVTVVDPQQSGHLTLWPSNSPQPGTSNLNFQAGQTIAAMVIVPVSADSTLRLFNGSGGTVHVIIDVAGYTLPGTPVVIGMLWSVTPSRIADSRIGLQIASAVPPLGTVGVPVTGPGSGAAAVTVTVTAVSPQASGYLTVWPSGTTRPGTSNLNFLAGRDIAATVVVPVGADGKVQLFNGSYGAVDLIVDIGGYTLAGATPGNGGAWAWGAGFGGQLGDGSTADNPVPGPVFGLGGITAIAAGFDTVYALRGDGTVWTWGTTALGSAAATGSLVPVQVSGLSGVTAVAGGFGTGYAVRGDGSVWAWGWGGLGQLGNGGAADSAVPVQVSGLSEVTAVAGGWFNGYAIRSNGTVWAWGAGHPGALGNGGTTNSLVPVRVSGLSTVTAIAAGFDTGYAVGGAGTVWAWGAGTDGALGNGSTADSAVPVQVSGISDAVAVAATGSTALLGAGANAYALRRNGIVMAWGAGGQLGNGGTSGSPVPVQVSALTAATGIAAGAFNGYAVTR